MFTVVVMVVMKGWVVHIADSQIILVQVELEGFPQDLETLSSKPMPLRSNVSYLYHDSAIIWIGVILTFLYACSA